VISLMRYEKKWRNYEQESHKATEVCLT